MSWKDQSGDAWVARGRLAEAAFLYFNEFAMTGSMSALEAAKACSAKGGDERRCDQCCAWFSDIESQAGDNVAATLIMAVRCKFGAMAYQNHMQAHIYLQQLKDQAISMEDPRLMRLVAFHARGLRV